MKEPRLRTVNKARPPYGVNQFPKEFIRQFAKDVVYMCATKTAMSLEGEEWEQIFADCIGAKWAPSNVGLDDVVLENCCWSAKTVKSGINDIGEQHNVRLISGRNSPTYSYGIDKITEENPNLIGKLVLEIWNERISAIRQYFKFARTVVLVKSSDYSEFLVFETETIRYEPDQYDFTWNARGNLEGKTKSDQKHKFTWQPHGSQFTIIEDIPDERVHIRIRKPKHLDKRRVLETIGFDDTWYSVL